MWRYVHKLQKATAHTDVHTHLSGEAIGETSCWTRQVKVDEEAAPLVGWWHGLRGDVLPPSVHLLRAQVLAQPQHWVEAGMAKGADHNAVAGVVRGVTLEQSEVSAAAVAGKRGGVANDSLCASTGERER